MNLTYLGWLSLGAAAVAVIVFVLLFRRKSSVYRQELPRIYELRDLAHHPASPDFYFRNLDQSLADIPQKLKQFRDLERDLESLDPVAWAFLKSELEPLLTAKDPMRGWEALLNRINQAKAYAYLKRSGYGHVAFIPTSSVKGKKTPDLKADNGVERALCEVKTINMSDIEAERRATGGAGTSDDQLQIAFFNKLGSTLRQAKAQIDAYDPASVCKKIAYVIINYDDSLHEYAAPYQLMIDDYLAHTHPAPGLHVEFDIKDPYYTAMS